MVKLKKRDQNTILFNQTKLSLLVLRLVENMYEVPSEILLPSRGKIQVYVNKEKFVFRLIVARLKYAGPIYLTPVISTMLKT
jgi:hypothetical protein